MTPGDLSVDPAARAAAVSRRFREMFGPRPRVYRAPGRVNIIGEHTDYNEGFVMPATLGLSCWVAAAPRGDGLLVVHSVNLDRRVELDCTQPLFPRGEWSDYVASVAVALQAEGCPMAGATLAIESDVPAGAGLGSSAAVQVGVATALLDLAGFTMDATSVAAMCQRAENEFVGAAVGIMDHFAAVHGRRGTALLLDCRSLSFRPAPLPSGIRLVACNTMVDHAHAGGEYNDRRGECQAAVARLTAAMPAVRAMRDLEVGDLAAAESVLDPVPFRRVRHVVTENARVHEAADALERGDLGRIAALMEASHESLRRDYEVSCRELDEMVALARGLPGVAGARMTGGGFGGCTVNLVDEEAVEEFCRQVPPLYEARTGRRPEIYATGSADGAARVEV